MGACRSIVSKQKIRFTENGFDLDLTYITPRIIAMGFPAEGLEASYRNRMVDVQRFFNHYHPDHARVYNLCAERSYSSLAFGSPPRVEWHPFSDHNPCPIHMIRPFCESAHKFLNEDPANVVAIHCKAGKGRTGMLISAYLLHSGICKTAEESVRLFGVKRTRNGKGVTIPSQMRYVRYYEQILGRSDPEKAIPAPRLRIKSMKMNVVPNFDPRGGCEPYFKVYQYSKESRSMEKTFNSKKVKGVHRVGSGANYMPLDDVNLVIQGDTKIVFFDRDRFSKAEKMFWFWFHTDFIDGDNLILEKGEVDNACGFRTNSAKAHFPAGFALQVFFCSPDDRAMCSIGESALFSFSTGSGLPSPPSGSTSSLKCFRRIFELFDTNDDGLIDVYELVTVLKNCQTLKIAPGELDAIAEDMDSHGDGSVLFLDFVRIMCSKLKLPNDLLSEEQVELLDDCYKRLTEKLNCSHPIAECLSFASLCVPSPSFGEETLCRRGSNIVGEEFPEGSGGGNERGRTRGWPLEVTRPNV